MHNVTDPHSHSDSRLTGLALAVAALCLMAPVNNAASGDKPQGILFSVRDYQRSGVVVTNAGEKVRILVELIGFVSGGRLRKHFVKLRGSG